MPLPVRFARRVLGGSVGVLWCLEKCFGLMIKGVTQDGVEVDKADFVSKCCRRWFVGPPGTALGSCTSLPWRAALWAAGFYVSSGLSVAEKTLKVPLGGGN